MFKNLVLTFSAFALVLVANVCGCGVCKANTADKTVKQSQFLMNEEPKMVTLKITGMSCAGCASHIHTALSKTEGIISDEVKYPGDVAIIKYDASKISVEQIIKVIEKTGYKAEVLKKEKNKQA
jgi:copper chaperone CopZ